MHPVLSNHYLPWLSLGMKVGIALLTQSGAMMLMIGHLLIHQGDLPNYLGLLKLTETLHYKPLILAELLSNINHSILLETLEKIVR